MSFNRACICIFYKTIQVYSCIVFLMGCDNMIDINLSKISKNYGFNNVLNNINLTINNKDKIALIGSNGSGKSTLLKLIAGIENKTSGEISIRKNITIGYLSQMPEILDINVREYIYDAFNEIIELENKLKKYETKLLSNDYKVINKYTKLQEEFINKGGYEYKTKISKVLAIFDITEEMLNRNFNTLSGGEKVRLKLFCLIQNNYNFLVLDEPTNHIDIDTREILEEALINYNGTILMVSHDRYFIDKVCNNIVEVKDKKINKYVGNYSDYKKNIKN